MQKHDYYFYENYVGNFWESMYELLKHHYYIKCEQNVLKFWKKNKNISCIQLDYQSANFLYQVQEFKIIDDTLGI